MIIYSYSDGSGNTYIIGDGNIEYKPVKPGFSSSGLYDGGEYVKKKLTTEKYNKILSVLNEAVKNRTIQIENRIMRSGLIKIEKNEKTTIYIIKPDSEEQQRIETILKKAINS